MKNAILLMAFLLLASTTFASTRLVPSQYDTIQEAIDHCVDGDTVIVAPGTYTGDGNRDIDFNGLAITVRSENGPTNCIIDCQATEDDQHRGFYFHNWEKPDSILNGFTITGGIAKNTQPASPWPYPTTIEYGGGIYCIDSRPTITNCIVTGNLADSGAGICIRSWEGWPGLNPIITNCLITGNTAKYFGGGINCIPGTILKNCTISANKTDKSGGGYYARGFLDEPPEYEGPLPQPPSGPQFKSEITNCIFFDNTSKKGPQIAFGHRLTSPPTPPPWPPPPPPWPPPPPPWGPIFPPYPGATATHLTDEKSRVLSVKYNDIEGGQDDLHIGYDSHLIWGPGNVDADPCFVEPGYWDMNDVWVDGDYHLLAGSPCIDAGDPNYIAKPNETDLDGKPRIIGGRIDMGADEFRGPIYVDNDAPEDQGPNNPDISDSNENGSLAHPFDAIQEAIDVASNGETVVVLDGTYTGPGNRDIDFYGLAVTVRSTDPNDPNIVANTVVDCEYSGRGFIFQSGEDANSVLTGLTVIHGMPIVPPPPPGPSPPPTHGGGICCRESSPTISNCVIKRNMAGEGGGISCRGGSPTISNCIIKRNTGGGGGGILCNYSSPKITNCTIYRNFARYTGGGIFCDFRSSPTINNCVINNNTAINYGYMGTIGGDGGGISCAENSNPIVTNSIINGNTAGSCCGGVSAFNSPPITIINSIIRDNSTVKDNSDSEIAGAATVTYSNVKGGWTGVGNIDAEPLLTWDYHLQAGSPCINAGDPNYSPTPDQTDMDSEPRIMGGRVDIGPDEFLDTDSDGLADWWEQKYFGDPNIANPADDSDGDEWTNLAEYTHSTEPNVVPTNYYVDPQEGDDSYDGLAPHWNGQHGPKEHIQPAVNACADRKNDIVTLAPGTYTGYSNKDIYFYGKAITVRSTDPCDPCVVAETIIDCERDESVGFVLVFNESPASVIKGLTITNGYAFIGMYSVNLVTKGGAIHCYRASPTIILSRIIANEAEDQGGGIYCYKGSPIITNCTFTGNSADESGGGIYSDSSSLTITNCTFTGNSADEGGGGIYSDSSSLTVTNCTVTGNSVNGQVVIGGGIFSDGSSLTITNCTITGNSVNGDWAAGSAIYSFVSSLTITNCNISGNIAELIGSIFCSQSDLNISNCTITDNTGPAQLYDGGIWCIDSNPTITNCILWNNSGEDGYEIGVISWKEAVTIRVLYSDVDGAEDSIDIGPDCILIWADNIDADPCFVAPGYWDVNGTPYDPWDDFWVEGDYHLLRTSPCIDAGDNNSVPADIHDLDGDGNTTEPIPFDLDGNPRIVDGNDDGIAVVDMGAYEAMVSCFGVNHIKLETKDGKKGNDMELKGAFDPALPIDLAVDDVAYIIDDGQGNMLAFLIPAGSFELEGKPEKQKFKFDSPKGSQPDIKAKFDFDKCKFELKAKKVQGTDEITSTTLTIELWAGANLVEEVVQVQVKPKHTEYKREPKLSCCPKCKGIALLEVTSTEPFTGDEYVLVFEPDPGKEKLKRKTVVDDGVNGRVKIDTSCSKPLEVGDVFGPYTISELVRIFE